MAKVYLLGLLALQLLGAAVGLLLEEVEVDGVDNSTLDKVDPCTQCQCWLDNNKV